MLYQLFNNKFVSYDIRRFFHLAGASKNMSSTLCFSVGIQLNPRVHRTVNKDQWWELLLLAGFSVSSGVSSQSPWSQRLNWDRVHLTTTNSNRQNLGKQYAGEWSVIGLDNGKGIATGPKPATATYYWSRYGTLEVVCHAGCQISLLLVLQW
jgi:hypothetical protein